MSGLTFKVFGTLDMIHNVHLSIKTPEADVEFLLDATSRVTGVDPTFGPESEVVFYDHYITFKSITDADAFALAHPGAKRS